MPRLRRFNSNYTYICNEPRHRERQPQLFRRFNEPSELFNRAASSPPQLHAPSRDHRSRYDYIPPTRAFFSPRAIYHRRPFRQLYHTAIIVPLHAWHATKGAVHRSCMARRVCLHAGGSERETEEREGWSLRVDAYK